MLTLEKQKEEILYENDFLTVFKIYWEGYLGNHVKSFSQNKPHVLLDSAGLISKLNNFSFLALRPSSVISFKNSRLEQNGCCLKNKDPFVLLRDFFYLNYRKDFEKLDFSPYIGGPIGYIAYDSGRYIEKLPSLTVDDLKLPDFYFIKPTLVLAHNQKTKELFVFLHHQDFKKSTSKVFDEIKKCLEKEDDLEQCKVVGNVRSNLKKKYFLEAVSKIRQHIYAGDVYQVNFSQRFVRNFQGESLALYKRLREVNPGAFCAYLKADDFSLLSSSPERLVSLNNKTAQTRPIAGTRRRGKNKMEDNFLSSNLLLDSKEKAEHIMLVDLERNDLGKVCRYNSVKVDELMILEKYSRVIHIVSNVCGELHKEKDAFDLLKAMFPGGTITGCPKVRCMEIIEELEPTCRGPYTGSLGYFSYNGNIDFNILIRTIVEVAGKVYIQVGAGIVADSKPEREYFETISKAQALFKSWGKIFKEEQWEKIST